jgi:cobalt transporter subunit CbtA
MIFRLLLRAILAGCVAGLVAGILQLWFVQPVLLHAELFESGELTHFGPDGPGPALARGAGFDPQRDLLTVAFTIIIYCGWSLVLMPLMAFAEGRGAMIDGRTGLIWGVAGFVTVLLAPAFSAAPGLPGIAYIDITVRQIWWFSTVLCTGLALWMLAFQRHPASFALAVALLLAPHAVGLPSPEEYLGPAPPELGSLMATRVLGVGLAAWTVLGSLAGRLWARASQRPVAQPG